MVQSILLYNRRSGRDAPSMDRSPTVYGYDGAGSDDPD